MGPATPPGSPLSPWTQVTTTQPPAMGTSSSCGPPVHSRGRRICLSHAMARPSELLYATTIEGRPDPGRRSRRPRDPPPSFPASCCNPRQHRLPPVGSDELAAAGVSPSRQSNAALL